MEKGDKFQLILRQQPIQNLQHKNTTKKEKEGKIPSIKIKQTTISIRVVVPHTWPCGPVPVCSPDLAQHHPSLPWAPGLGPGSLVPLPPTQIRPWGLCTTPSCPPSWSRIGSKEPSTAPSHSPHVGTLTMSDPAHWEQTPKPAWSAQGSSWVWRSGSSGVVTLLPHYQTSRPMESPVGQVTRHYGLEMAPGPEIEHPWIKEQIIHLKLSIFSILF